MSPLLSIYRSCVQKGFTLVELLVCLGIFAILVAISLPAVQLVRERSRKLECWNKQRQIVLALHSYEASHSQFPSVLGARFQHWQSKILPFADQKNLSDAIDAEFQSIVYPIYHPTNLESVAMLQCGTNPDQGTLIGSEIGSFAFTDYCGVAGISSNFGLGFFSSIDLKGIGTNEIHDGLSNTLCFGERPPSPAGFGFGRWLTSQNMLSASIGVYEDFDFLLANQESNEMDECLPIHVGYQPGQQRSRFDWLHHWSFHLNGSNFAFADGSVRMIPYSVSPDVLKATASVDGGESVSIDF